MLRLWSYSLWQKLSQAKQKLGWRRGRGSGAREKQCEHQDGGPIVLVPKAWEASMHWQTQCLS